MNKQDVETTGKNYVYIEILRQVSPDQPYSEFEYFLLGGFDAMKIGLEENIGALKKRFEKGQESTPELFDRQPLFLYTSQNMAEIDSENSIFYRYGEYAARPLIVTLFQLDKFRLARNEEIQTPELLINAFAKLVETEMSEQGITEDRIEYQVFWNLGESDVVTIFRPSTLNILAQILHALRMKENADSQQPIRIISTSSHCAFPKPDITEKMRKKEIRDIFRKHLKIWLYKEFENISQEFLTLVNISDIYHDRNSKADLMFGEWDYIYRHQKEEKQELVSSLTDIFTQLVRPTTNADFKSSYTIPVLKLFTDTSTIIEERIERNEITKQKKKKERQWIEKLYGSMMALKQQVESAFGETAILMQGTYETQLLDTLNSFAYSVDGIAKFLYRLKEGRFEEDLYAYVKPVFESLTRITNNFIEKIVKLQQTGHGDAIDAYVRSYLSDTADLLGKLQHLFSIMAVSPHTFMETYGSNMRSLAASDKLLNAYQGLIRFLEDKFPNQISGRKSSHAILVLPYRGTQSMHMLLYGNSNPMYRISYIQIDFTKMFYLESTVFMLLHECGHHLGDRLRKERFRYLAEASICACFEWIGAERFLQDPLHTFLSRLNKGISREEVEKEEYKLFAGIEKAKTKAIKDWLENNIMEEIKKGVCLLGSIYTKDIESDYRATIKYNVFGELQKCYFRNQVVNYLANKFIPSMFCIQPEEISSIEIENAYNNQRIIIEESVRNEIGGRLVRIAQELADKIIVNGGNIREALRLKRVYSEVNNFARGLMERSAYLIEVKIKERAIEELGEMFSDIYSDVFAIRILDIGVNEYVTTISCLLGPDLHDILASPSLFRVFAVLDALWNIEADEKEKAIWLLSNKDSQISEELCKQWNIFERLSYRDCLIKYAKKCDAKMIELVKRESESEQQGDPSLTHLRNMLNENNKTGQINGVFYYCKYLMKGDMGKDGAN